MLYTHIFYKRSPVYYDFVRTLRGKAEIDMKQKMPLIFLLIVLILCSAASCDDGRHAAAEIYTDVILLPEEPRSVAQDACMIYALCGGNVLGTDIVTGRQSDVIEGVPENAVIDAFDGMIAVCSGSSLSVYDRNGKKQHYEMPVSDIRSLALTASYVFIYGRYDEELGFYITNLKTSKSEWTSSSLNIVQMCGAENDELILYIGDDTSMNSYIINYDLKNDIFVNRRSLNISSINAMDYDLGTGRTVYMYDYPFAGVKYIKSLKDGTDVQTTDAVLDISDEVSFVTCGAGTTAYTRGSEIKIVLREEAKSLSLAWFGEYDCNESRRISYEYYKQTGNIVNETVFDGDDGLSRFKMKILAGEDDIDMYIVRDETAALFAAAGAFYELTDLGVSSGTIDKIRNNEEILSCAEYDGRIVGLPVYVQRVEGDDFELYPGMEKHIIDSVNIIEYMCRCVDAVDGSYSDRSGNELMDALKYTLNSNGVYETYSGPLGFLSIRMYMVNPSTSKKELVCDYLDFAAELLNRKDPADGITPWNSESAEGYPTYWKSYNLDCTILLSDLFKDARDNSIADINEAVRETAEKINLILTE